MLPSPVRATVGFAFISAASIVWTAMLIPLLPWRVLRIKACNYYGKLVGYSITRLAGATPKVHHQERIQASYPAIYCANHTSLLDAFLSIWLCPVGGCGVMKKEVLKIPFFGQLYFLSGHLRIDRQDHARAVAALAETAQVVKDNALSIWIMPEGSRSHDGRLRPFKKGIVHLAIATGLDVVPVVFHRAHHNWPRKRWRFTPMEVEVDVLPAVSTKHWRAETAEAHAAEVHDRIAEALHEDQRPLAGR